MPERAAAADRGPAAAAPRRDPARRQAHDPGCAAACSRSARSRAGSAELTIEERELAREIEALARKLAPQLLDQPGVGPHAAAWLVLAWSHHGRIHSEAAFAQLAGAAPIPASSGQTIRYRLDRSGDRKLNRALHMILVTRKRAHPGHHRLHRTPPRGEQNTTRSQALPQALPRPQPLPATRARTAAAADD